MQRNLLRRVFYSIVPLVALLVFAELGTRAYYYQLHSGYALGLQQLFHRVTLLKPPPEAITRHVYDRVFFRPDSVTGYTNVPGIHNISLVGKSGTWKCRAVINHDGYRTNSAHPESYAGKPEAWMFGCSITWGFPLNNEDSFPWLMQAEMPNVYIRSLAEHGYGNAQALLQLQNAIDRQTKLPVVAVFNYNPFHRDRNVALPS